MHSDASQPTAEQAEQMKEGARVTWAAGDFDAVAHHTVWTVGPDLVQRAGISEGERVLDVACGSGNSTLPAARTGATVIGLDITRSLLEAARGHAEEEGLQIDFVEGDAEALPFDDAHFDVVISSFGVMFAPRHQVAANELARVTKPGGRIAVACWTPTGAVGDMFRTTSSHLPASLGTPPVAWGNQDHVSELLGGKFGLEFAPTNVVMNYDSLETGLEFFESNFGPLVMARKALEPEGKWEALHQDMVELWRQDQADDGSVSITADYLVTTGRRNDAPG